MSPKAGFILLDQIAPRLRATIPYVVSQTGSEDAQELLQDVLREVCQRPRWQATVEGEQEQMRCRYEQRRCIHQSAPGKRSALRSTPGKTSVA